MFTLSGAGLAVNPGITASLDPHEDQALVSPNIPVENEIDDDGDTGLNRDKARNNEVSIK